MTYDIDYFIRKFEAIPEERWIRNTYHDEDDQTKACVIGHCGVTTDFTSQQNAETSALKDIAAMDPRKHKILLSLIFNVNDGVDPDFQQPTPKQRILAWLKAIKEFYA